MERVKAIAFLTFVSGTLTFLQVTDGRRQTLRPGHQITRGYRC